jgi:hypothetical protein
VEVGLPLVGALDVPAVEVTPHPRARNAAKKRIAKRAARGVALRRVHGMAKKSSPAGNRIATDRPCRPPEEEVGETPAATVAIVTVAEAVIPRVSWREAGLTVQVELDGAPLQENVSGPLDPAAGVICSV